MIRVGQCESCEGWYRAGHLEPARVVKPNLAARERGDDILDGAPGLGPEPGVAHFCPDCYGAIRDAERSRERHLLRPGDPEFSMSPRALLATVAGGEEAE